MHIRKFALEIIVFVSGAVVMILELTGMRILAPYAGTSAVVWTSLIGVILGFLSIGYSFGGKLADRIQSFKKLGDILLLSAALVVLINLLRPFGLFFSQNLFSDVRLGSVFLAIFLFGPASFALGMIPTYCVRLKIKVLKTSGATVGRLYALSTLGSILGTFLGGFVLISTFGNRNIIYLLSLILGFASAISYSLDLTKRFIFPALLVFFLASLNFTDFSWYKDKKVILDTDSQYSRIIVAQMRQPGSEKSIQALFTGRLFYQAGGYQSAIYLEDPSVLAAKYLQFFLLAEYFTPKIERALLMGGGAYVFPRYFLTKNPSSSIDIVELDPKITQIAKDNFFLKEDPRIRIYPQDGRTYLNKNTKKYDAVYLDAFNDLVLPFHLTTLEATNLIFNSLDEDGVLVVNIISALNGSSGKVFRAIYTTYKSVFPNVYVFPVTYPGNTNKIQNIVLIATKEKINLTKGEKKDEYSKYLNNLLEIEIGPRTPILTDDFAPLDYYYLLM